MPPAPTPNPLHRYPQGMAELILDEQHYARVVVGGILAARVSLDIRTADFKAMRTPTGSRQRARSILDVFRSLAEQGVEIRLLHAGVPSGPVLEALRGRADPRLTIRRCPRQHAKIVVVDCRAMYVGSANLTGAGLGAKSERKRNFEAGLWTHAPELIDPVLERFNALWEGRLCGSCRQRRVCPVPLEEPDLG